jgi:hypothetical protein
LPGVINLDCFMISGGLEGEELTLSLNLFNKFLSPLSLVILAISYSLCFFFFLSSSYWLFFFFLWLLDFLEMKELSNELQMLPNDWFSD